MSNTIETDVELGVEGSQIKAAFDNIDARIANIQKHIDTIVRASAGAAEAFGGKLQQQIGQITKTVSALEKIERIIAAPQKAQLAQWDKEEAAAQRLADEKRKLRALDDKQARERLAQIELEERAANRLATEERKLREQERKDQAASEKAQLAQWDREEAAANRLAEEKRRLRAQAKRDDDQAARDRLAQIELEERAANRLASEQRKLRDADRREQQAIARSDNAVGARLSVRSGRIDERALVSNMDSVTASARQAELETKIANQIERAADLSGRELVEAEQLLKIDEARLTIVKSRVADAAREERAAQRATTLANKPAPTTGAPVSRVGQVFSPEYAAGAFARTALYGAAAMASFGAFNAVQSEVSDVVQLDEKLKQLQAVADATDTQMAQLKTAIFDVGATSKYSLTDLTDMAEKLAQTGVSASGMKDALSAVAQLATASGSTPQEAVDLVTAALGSFQLQGKEAARVADLMTTALNRTRLTVQQAASAIQYVGATAYEQNITLEQLLATTAAIAQAGVRSGSTLGTGMRQFLVDLQTPSEKLNEQLKRLGLTQADVDVSTRGLAAVLDTLSKAGFGAAQAYSGLEQRAAAWYLIAKNNIPLMDELQMQMADQGAVATANERAMNSLAAQWQRFKNLMTEDFSNSAEGILNVFKNVLEKISDQMSDAQKLAKGQAGGTGAPEDDWVMGKAVSALDWLDRHSHPDGKYGSSIFSRDLPLGTWLKNLANDANDATGKMQQLETAVSDTTSKAQDQADTVNSLDKEILRLNTQKQDLIGHEQRVNAETVSLMSRFQGLSQYVVGATGDINGLIGALQNLRSQEAGALVDDLKAQAGALYQRELDAKTSRESAVGQIRGNSDLMAALKPQERAALNQLGGNNGRIAAAMLLDAAKRFQETQEGWSKLLTSAAANRQTEYSMAGQRGVIDQRAGYVDGSRSVYGKSFEGSMSHIEGELPRLRDARDEIRQTLEKSLLDELARDEQGTKQLLASGGVKKDQIPYLQDALGRIQSMRQQVLEAVLPSKEDEKALKKHIGKGLNINAPDMAKRLEAAFPGIVISSARERHPGDPGYTRGSLHTMPGGNAVDITKLPAGITPDNIIAFIEAQGVNVPDTPNGFLNEFVHPSKRATGGHYHFGWTPKPSAMSQRAERDAAKAERQREQEQQRAAREAEATDQFQLSTDDKNVTDALKKLKYASTDEMFAAGEQQAKDAVDIWADQLKKTTMAQLARQKATPTEIKARMAEVDQRIKQRREEVSTSIFDYFEKSIQQQVDLIQQQYQRSLEPYELGVSLAQGRLQGLGYQSLKGKVPDFVQQLAERNAGYAQENLAKAQSGSLGTQITSMNSLIASKQGQLQDHLNEWDPDQIKDARDKLKALTDQVAQLTKQKGELDAALGADGLLPKTWSQGLHEAIDAYREANGLNLSFQQQMMQNFTGAFTAGQEAVSGFFNDILTGTTSVIGAFQNMAGAVIKYLQQIIVKMIAMKVMEMALNLFGGKGPDTSSLGSTTSLGAGPGLSGMADIPLARIYGGPVMTALTGRYITDGVPNRDSVNAKIAKGEFVQRKWAVDSVGVDFMKRLNEQGAGALTGLVPKIVMPQQARQEMKVFVVQPEHTPTMGPNDVLVTIANDITNGGPTKQLIKYVAQGG